MSVFLVGLIGAVVSAVVGTIWFSPGTPMGKWHMQYLGFDKLSEEEKQKLIAQAKPKMWKSYTGQFILAFLSAVFIGMVTSYSVQNGAAAGSVYYYVPMIWLCFTVPMIGQNIIWGTCEGPLAWKRFFSESLSSLVTYMIIAFVANLFF